MNKAYLILAILVSMSSTAFGREPILESYSYLLIQSYPQATLISEFFAENPIRCSATELCPGKEFAQVITLKSQTGSLHTVVIPYKCEPIDDGAYGNLSCVISGSVQEI